MESEISFLQNTAAFLCGIPGNNERSGIVKPSAWSGNAGSIRKKWSESVMKDFEGTFSEFRPKWRVWLMQESIFTPSKRCNVCATVTRSVAIWDGLRREAANRSLAGNNRVYSKILKQSKVGDAQTSENPGFFLFTSFIMDFRLLSDIMNRLHRNEFLLQVITIMY